MRGDPISPADRRRCTAPTRTDGGVIQCVSTVRGCWHPEHRRWDPIAPLMRVVWFIRPWWPNKLGRAQDRGEAHTPNVQPCRACRNGVPGPCR